MKQWFAVWVLGLSAVAAVPARAELLAYDSFTYDISANQNLNTRDGGDAWTGAWSTNSGTSITPLNIVQVTTPLQAGNVYGGSHAISMPGGSTGGAVVTVAAYRTFTQQTTADVWFSFLLRTPATIGADDFLQFALNNDTDQSNSASIGDTNVTDEKFSIRIGGSNGGTTVSGTGSNADILPATDYLLVGRVSKAGTANGDNSIYDLVDMWVNPTDWGVPDASSFIVSRDLSSNMGSVGYITIRTANFENTPYLFDELRIATTYTEVLPEPGSLSLVGLGALALLRRRRRSV